MGLPSWFYLPAGLWELAGVLLATPVFSKPDVGLPLLFTFMGGVFSVIFYVPAASGHPLISFKHMDEAKEGVPPLISAVIAVYVLFHLGDGYPYINALLCGA